MVRFWEEKEGGGCKNQIHPHCHCWDKGGREDFMIATPERDDTHANSAVYAYIFLVDVQLAAREGGGAAQDAVEDDGGGMVVGGGEDCSKDCSKDRSNAEWNGHGRGHGHGQCGHNDEKSIGGG